MNMKIALSALILAFSFFNVLAQQKTAYEKRMDSIAKKYVFGNRELTIMEEAELKVMLSEQRNILKLVLMNYAPTHTRTEVKKLALQMDIDIKNAQKLKTSVDFQRENARNAKAEQAKRNQAAIEAQSLYEETDMGYIQKQIKEDFLKWNKRGEFEKQTDFETRINEQSQNVFNQTCITQIQNCIQDYNEYISKELLPYNTEEECFRITFEIDNGTDNEADNVKWQSKIHIPIISAEKFKNSWSELKTKCNEYDWCIIKNTLSPTVITLSDGSNQYQVINSFPNSKEVTFSFDDLGIENLVLKGKTFRLSDVKFLSDKKKAADSVIAENAKIAREIFVKDSLEILNSNSKLALLLEDYNRQLIKNPYNIEKKIIEKYQTIAQGENMEDHYNKSVTSLMINYKSICDGLDSTFNQEYLSVNQLFLTKDDFCQFYKEGKKQLNVEITKRQNEQEENKILNYLKTESSFLENVNLQPDRNGEYHGDDIIYFTKLLRDIRTKTYYIHIIDVIFDTNKDLNKEWARNGNYFNNKAALYDAYISGEYRQLLNIQKMGINQNSEVPLNDLREVNTADRERVEALNNLKLLEHK